MQAIETDIKGMACTISRSGYCGEDGFEISLADANAQQLAELLLSFPQVQPIGLGARDTLRLEAGLSLYGHELSVDINPVEAGLRWLIAKINRVILGLCKFNSNYKMAQHASELVC